MVAATVLEPALIAADSCDLLKIYYLCGSSNSLVNKKPSHLIVVICLKFTTFVVAATVTPSERQTVLGCDLLKIYYLCGSSNSGRPIIGSSESVVICLKFTTFVVAATV